MMLMKDRELTSLRSNQGQPLHGDSLSLPEQFHSFDIRNIVKATLD